MNFATEQPVLRLLRRRTISQIAASQPDVAPEIGGFSAAPLLDYTTGSSPDLPDFERQLVCWLSGNIEGGEIKVRRVQADETVGPPSVIAKTDISRSSGFPRMARSGNEVHFAWTEFGKPSRVRTATADVGLYK